MCDSQYRRVFRITDVLPGQQIAVRSDRTCTMRYYHQAIVEFVNHNHNTFDVIERLPGGVRRNAFIFDGKEFWVIHNPDRCYTLQTTVSRARSRIGDRQYSFRYNNSEHFAEWCVTGMSRSYQIEAISGVKLILLPVLGMIWDLIDYLWV